MCCSELGFGCVWGGDVLQWVRVWVCVGGGRGCVAVS